MVLDAPSANGPFQPVALMHFRGEAFVLLCLSAEEGCYAMICGRRYEGRSIRAAGNGFKRLCVTFTASCPPRLRF